MDVHEDASNKLRRYSDGAYMYRSPKSYDFDANTFNRYYEQYRVKRDRSMRRHMVEKIDELDERANIPMPHQETIGSILIKTKDAMFNMLDDILQHLYTLNTLTKNNRLFYIGIMVLIISAIIFIYYLFTHKKKLNTGISDHVIEVRLKKN